MIDKEGFLITFIMMVVTSDIFIALAGGALMMIPITFYSAYKSMKAEEARNKENNKLEVHIDGIETEGGNLSYCNK